MLTFSILDMKSRDVPAAFALAETIPDILAEAYSELRWVLSLVDGTGTAQAVSAPFEPER